MAYPGYYSKEIGNNETLLEPVWLLYGNTESGSRLSFHIYARQFANFTATPTVASIGDPVQFTDTSDTSPVTWHWDFGDGTTSTEQNPAHAYSAGGNYTVSLKAWNDLGSDTITRQDYITVHRFPKPVAGCTSNYSWEDGHENPVIVAFADASAGNITRWFWDFGDGTNSTEQNPVHAFRVPYGETSCEYDIRLTVTDDIG